MRWVATIVLLIQQTLFFFFVSLFLRVFRVSRQSYAAAA